MPIAYDYIDDYGCQNIISKDAQVEKVTGTISNLKSYYCYDEDTITLTYSDITNPSTAIGKFYGNGITDLGNNTALFIPSLAYNADTNIVDSIATITLAFEYLGSDNKTIFTKTQTTKVRNNGSVTIDNLNDTTGYCANAETVNLEATPQGGVFTGKGISGTQFVPANVGDTATIINYTYTHAASGCSNSVIDTIPILSVPTLVFDVPAQVCSNAEVDTLIGYPRGGEITTQLSIAQLAGFTDSVKFTPNPDFIGSRKITYTFTNPENNCTNTLTKTIKTDTIPNIAIDFTMPQKGFCKVDEEISIEGEVDGLNALSGFFKADGILDTLQNNGKGKYNPILVEPGDDPITFTYTDANGCTNIAQFDAIVNGLPKLSINGGEFNDTAFCGNYNSPVSLNGSYINGDVHFVIDNQTIYNANTSFYPSAYGNQDEVVITFNNTDENGCSNSVTNNIEILNVPENTFEMSSICIANPIEFNYLGSATIVDLDSVIWDFGDNSTSKQLNALHYYEVPEQVTVQLHLYASNGCENHNTKVTNLETSPNSFFNWKNECISDNAVEFASASQESTYKHTWDFGDGTIDSTNTNPNKSYRDVGTYFISHSVQSGNSICKSTSRDTITIRPTYTITSKNDYFEDFEEDHGFWIPEKLDTASNYYTWQLGLPNGNIINTVPGNEGSNVYATNTNGVYDTLENNAVTSPCFIFEGIYRPMISMDIFRDIESKSDGAVFEYTTDNGDTWIALGDKGEGLYWFNDQNIRSLPGNNSNLGWSDQGSGWEDSRHDLDILVDQEEGKSNGTIRFRIAFRSDEYADTILKHEGFAFDNIRIGDRKRRVLVEHFTNTGSSIAKSSSNDLNSIMHALAKDAIDIQYHTSIDANDPFYTEYPIGSSSREAYYGINDVPFTYFDGEVIFDYSDIENTPDEIKLKSQALTEPEFKMTIESAKTNTGINVKVNTKALDKIENRQLQLFVALVEKSVVLNSETNNLQYQNVLRRFLPTPGGTYIDNNWEKGTSKTHTFNYSFDDYIDNSDSIIAIAFIQDEFNKEVLQTISTDKAHLSTTIKPWLSGSDQLDFILYPNPASESVYFALGKTPATGSEIQIIDQSGKVIDIIEIPENATSSFYNLSHLKEGLYYVKWINSNEQKIKKLIKLH